MAPDDLNARAAAGRAPAITNPKLASVDPTWAPYRGLSVLFDNPPTTDLYDELAGALADFALDRLREDFAFCPLARPSYHVTVCDGPNEHSLSDATGPLAGEMTRIVHGLPNSLVHLSPAADVLLRAEVLATVAANPVTVGPGDVVVWGDVLAVRLEPADRGGAEALRRITDARSVLVDRLREVIGVRVEPWRPHLSLGYFPRRDLAQRASPAVAVLSDRLDAMDATPVTFASAAVYAFTDMVSFLRVGP